MTPVRSQHADLVRHRELNALRRLMAQRDPNARLGEVSESTVQVSRFASTQAISQINALEMQMSQQLMGVQPQGDFGRTRIAPLRDAQTQKSNIEIATVKNAAEHFANNRMAQAQTILENAISVRGLQHDHPPTWLVFLDFCRATNLADRFEAYALDFSVRFGRSTPPWMSIPHQAELASREQVLMPVSRTGATRADWTAPLFLTRIELRALNERIQETQNVSRQLIIDWRDLVAIDGEHWSDLQIVLENLASMPLHCKVHGIEMLEKIFDASSAPAMLAHLALLRCENRAQSFEEMALNYCMKYEVSPPDWTRPLCRFEAADMPLTAPSTPAFDQVAEIFGVLEGDHAVSRLSNLDSSHGYVIRCDRLVRCDAAATAALVRWADGINRSGHQAVFKNVHRLMQTYFAAQGLTEHAKVTVRKD